MISDSRSYCKDVFYTLLYLAQQGYFDSEYRKYRDYELENWRRSYVNRVFEVVAIGRSAHQRFYLDIGVGSSGYTVIEATKEGVWILYLPT